LYGYIGLQNKGIVIIQGMLRGNPSFFVFIGYSLYNWSIVDVIELEISISKRTSIIFYPVHDTTIAIIKIETETAIEELEGEDDVFTTSLIAELEKLELSSTEARIFLFLSKMGPCSASDIARGMKVPRTGSYRHIGSLLARGLLTSTFTKP
jgi:hypothetical protein